MPYTPQQHGWKRKFAVAWRGLKLGVRGQSSFFVHFFVAALVVVAGIVLGVSRVEWCILILCIHAVLASELFNSAIEWLAKAVSVEEHPQIAAALDISCAAVLVAAIGASTVGLIIFINRLGLMLQWWPAAH